MSGWPAPGSGAATPLPKEAPLKITKTWSATAMAVALVLGGTLAHAADAPPEVRLTIENGRFAPEEVRVRAGAPFMLVVTNKDAEAEEFESEALRIEKVILPGKTLRLKMRGLRPGTYDFVGERDPERAKGRIIAE